ncbi:MAG TPA: glycosyltransferase family 39 protein [Candidatus Bilamarchaeum sp.]|nr:glycosyltransferase family 39 protein [Candidatus Bilamarchaeum sp.]
MKIPEKEEGLMAILAIVYALLRLPVSLLLPFIRDEALYAIMIEEQKLRLTLVPTFLGHFVSWKPPLFFWAYLPFTYLPLPLELSYRLPSMLIGLATIPLLFRLLRNAGISRNMAFFSMLFSLFSIHTIYPNATLLTDSLMFFFMSLSLLLYTEKKLPGWRFIAAGAAAFLAFFAKLVVAFMIPVLALVYIYTFDRPSLRKPLFIISLLAVPLALLTHYAVLDQAGLASELYQSDVGGHFFSGSVAGQLELLQTTVWALLVTGGMIWISLAAFGFIGSWRENLFMSAWFLFSAVPLLSSAFLLWYYLPVMPAICYFALKCLAVWKGKERYDEIFFIVFSVFSFALLAFSGYIAWVLYDSFEAEREAGYLLSGKEGVLVAGYYAPSIIAYKVLPEMRRGGLEDFGWVVIPDNYTEDRVSPYIEDYRSEGDEVVDGSFSSFFTKTAVFRKETNLTDFSYVAVSKAPDVHAPGEVIFNRSNITVYKVQ